MMEDGRTELRNTVIMLMTARLLKLIYISKNWFHVGLRLFLTELVVYVWSASTETTANGSGRAKSSRLTRELAARTGNGEA